VTAGASDVPKDNRRGAGMEAEEVKIITGRVDELEARLARLEDLFHELLTAEGDGLPPTSSGSAVSGPR
jgi:hypothetical protein